MNISLYKKWITELKLTGYNFKSFEAYENIFNLSFKEKNVSVYIADDVLCVNTPTKKIKTESVIITDDADFKVTPDLKNINFHLNHSKLKEIRLINNDKIIVFHFTKWNIYNKLQDLYLILELIPRYQNIILATNENDKMMIIDCKKKISMSDNLSRQILPGNEYKPPNTSYIHEESALSNINNNVNEYFKSHFNNICLKKIDNLKQSILKEIEKDLKKAQNKLIKQESELKSDDDIQTLYQYVELLKSSLEKIDTGAESVIVKNYFMVNFPDIEIKLNPILSPQKNLNLYVKKYKKALNGQKIITLNITTSKQEISSILALKEKVINETSYIALNEYKKDKSDFISRDDKQKTKLFRILKINDNWEISIGRSSKENDLLTCKTAKPDDWWFHCRIYKGTHVVLRNFLKKEPSDDLILLCCGLAAYYSKAKNSLNVPIDYTKIRYVRKPKGSAPGFVTYKNQKTIFVNPIDFRDAAKYIDKINL